MATSSRNNKKSKKAAVKKKAPARKKATVKKKAVAKKKPAKKSPTKKPAPSSRRTGTVKKAAPKKKAASKAAPKKKKPAKKVSQPLPAKVARSGENARALGEKMAMERNEQEARNTPTEQNTQPITQEKEDPFRATDKKAFAKFTAKGDPHQRLYLSNKSKGGPKPSGKKPLWNK